MERRILHLANAICFVSLAKRQCQMMCKSDPSSQEIFHYVYKVTYPLSWFLMLCRRIPSNGLKRF